MTAENSAAATLVASLPRLKVDGEEVRTVQEALRTLEIWLAPNQPAVCRLRLNNWGSNQAGEPGYLFDGEGPLAHGATLEVFAGMGDGAHRIFEGEIYRLDGMYFSEARPPEVEVVAYDRLARLGLVRRSRSFTELTDSELADFLAGEYGLNTNFQISQSLPRHHHLVQVEQSDLEFLQERLADLDVLMRVENDTLQLESWLSAGAELVALAYQQQLLEARLAADLQGQASQLHLPGWNPAQKQVLMGEAEQSSLSGETGGLQSGPELIEQIFGRQRDQKLHHPAADASQADTSAQTHFRQRSRGFVRGRLVAQLQPNLRPGSRVVLSRLGTRFDGNYRVVSVVQRFDSQGFRTHLEVTRSGQSLGTRGKPGASRPDPAQTKKRQPSITRPDIDKTAKDTPQQQGGKKHDTD